MQIAFLVMEVLDVNAIAEMVGEEASAMNVLFNTMQQKTVECAPMTMLESSLSAEGVVDLMCTALRMLILFRVMYRQVVFAIAKMPTRTMTAQFVPSPSNPTLIVPNVSTVSPISLVALI